MAERILLGDGLPRIGRAPVRVRNLWRHRARAVVAGAVATAAVACGGSTENADAGSSAAASSEAESTGVAEPAGVGESQSSQSGIGEAKSSLIKVGTGPCCLVARDDGIWVMNLRDATIQHVDPRSNEPDEPMSVFPYEKMIGAGDNILLEEPGGGVALFDPATSKVGRRIPVAGGMRGMAFDATSETLWVGSARDGTLIHIDANSGRVLDTFTVQGLPDGGDIIPTSNNELWVAPFSGEILKVDLAQQRVVTLLKPFPADAAVSLVSAGGHLWATSIQRPTLLRIDPSTGKIDQLGDIDAAGAAFPWLFAAPDGTLWVAAAPDRIQELDPENGDILKTYDIPLADDADVDTYYNVGGITTGFGSVWTAIFDDFSADDALVRLER